MSQEPIDARRLVGQVVAGRYRIDALIGEGGMGAVYRAEHLMMHKPLAVKVLHAEMQGIEEAVERFEREAIAGAHIQHPNVAAASDFGRLDDGSHFLVLEYLDGIDLRKVIGRGALEPERALGIAHQMALALGASHALGIVHRDLKPENVMLLDRNGSPDFVKVLDFGLAKVPVDDLGPRSGGVPSVAITQLGMVYGTPEYMAPEQALGQEIDGRADLYALGVILFEMLAGARPFDSPERAALLALVTGSPPPSLRTWAPGVNDEVEAIVLTLLEKSAGQRFADAASTARAIDAALANLRRGDDTAQDKLARSMPRVPPPPPSSTGRRPSLAEVSPTVAFKPRVSLVSIPHVEMGRNFGDRSPIVLGVLGIAAIFGLVTAAVMLRGPQTVDAMEALASAGATASVGAAPFESAAPASAASAPLTGARANPAELDAAKAGGLTVLGPLAQHYPNDIAVLRALLLAHASDRTSYVAAMHVAKRMFELSPASANDEEVKQVILMAANGTPDAASAAFEVMTQMGTAGPDLLYELVVAPSVGKLPKDRATALLSDPQVLEKATPALRIANELRLAQACQRKPLLAKARDQGDARALHYLSPLEATTGCGFLHRGDCYGCFGNRKELKEVIETIEHRSAKK